MGDRNDRWRVIKKTDIGTIYAVTPHWAPLTEFVVLTPDGMDAETILEASELLRDRLSIDPFSASSAVRAVWRLIADAVLSKDDGSL